MTLFGAPARNVGLFVAALMAATVVLAIVDYVLSSQFGTSGAPAGAWIGPFAAATVVAGHSYASKVDWVWVPADRRRLATAYSVVAVAISAIFTLGAVILDPAALGRLPAVWTILIFVLGTAFGGLISYFFALALLVYAVRPKAKKAVSNSNLGESTK